jgi:hypothetical protein
LFKYLARKQQNNSQNNFFYFKGKAVFVICNALQLNYSNNEDIFVEIPLGFFCLQHEIKKRHYFLPVACFLILCVAWCLKV